MLTAPAPVRLFSRTSLTPFLPSSHPIFSLPPAHTSSPLTGQALPFVLSTDDIYEGNFCSSPKGERKKIRVYSVLVCQGVSCLFSLQMLLCRDVFEDHCCACVCGTARCLMSEVTVRCGGGHRTPGSSLRGPSGPLTKRLKRQGAEKTISGAGQECESREATNPRCAVCYAGAGRESDSR